MPQVFGIDVTTLKMMGHALDVASLRQQTIASNIANIHTPGYKPLTVAFESQMRAMTETERQWVETPGKPMLVEQNVNEVEARKGLDQYMVELADNAVRYQALIKGISKYFGIYSLAVSDGKR